MGQKALGCPVEKHLGQGGVMRAEVKGHRSCSNNLHRR